MTDENKSIVPPDDPGDGSDENVPVKAPVFAEVPAEHVAQTTGIPVDLRRAFAAVDSAHPGDSPFFAMPRLDGVKDAKAALRFLRRLAKEFGRPLVSAVHAQTGDPIWSLAKAEEPAPAVPQAATPATPKK